MVKLICFRASYKGIERGCECAFNLFDVRPSSLGAIAETLNVTDIARPFSGVAEEEDLSHQA